MMLIADMAFSIRLAGLTQHQALAALGVLRVNDS